MSKRRSMAVEAFFESSGDRSAIVVPFVSTRDGGLVRKAAFHVVSIEREVGFVSTFAFFAGLVSSFFGGFATLELCNLIIAAMFGIQV